MKRYRINNETLAVEFPLTPEGFEQAKQYRKTNSAFKRRKIREVFQFKPDDVKVGVPYRWNFIN